MKKFLNIKKLKIHQKLRIKKLKIELSLLVHCFLKYLLHLIGIFPP